MSLVLLLRKRRSWCGLWMWFLGDLKLVVLCSGEPIFVGAKNWSIACEMRGHTWNRLERGESSEWKEKNTWKLCTQYFSSKPHLNRIVIFDYFCSKNCINSSRIRDTLAWQKAICFNFEGAGELSAHQPVAPSSAWITVIFYHTSAL